MLKENMEITRPSSFTSTSSVYFWEETRQKELKEMHRSTCSFANRSALRKDLRANKTQTFLQETRLIATFATEFKVLERYGDSTGLSVCMCIIKYI